MKKNASLALILLFSLFIPAAAQAQNPPPSPAPQTIPQQGQKEEDEVVRITTNLVQVDAVVTDKKGKLVTDLKPEDFEIYEDGHQQKITNFSLVSTESETAQPVATKPPVDKTAPAAPPVRLRPDQVRRTIAIVVDDLGLSFESTAYVRRALRKFVEQQVQPGDLVAIIRTAGGMGALQQFTSDKQQLNAAVERVKWNPLGNGGVSAFAPIDDFNMGQSMTGAQGGSGSDATGKAAANDASEDLDQFRTELFSVGMLGALNYVVHGMRELPGRKSILLVSDGFTLFNKERTELNARITEALRRLTDSANRASVVIYTMDARGLPTLGLTAADSVGNLTPDQLSQQLNDRSQAFRDSQDGLIYLAQQTGGIAIRNSNDLGAGIRRVLDDQKGYYLIGYRPDESTFDPKTGRRQFHKISVKVKRPGLSVRSRTGFYGVTTEERRARSLTPRDQLIGALTSPFAESGVHLRLTSLYGNDPKIGSFVRSLLHVEGHDLTFTDDPDGWHKAVFDVLAVTFGDNGTIVDQIARTQTMRVRGETYNKLLREGFVYVLTVPVKKTGAYQLRTALRDETSSHVGSATQFIEVPNLGKNRLTISGIIVQGLRITAARAGNEAGALGQPGAAAAAPAPNTTQEGVIEADPQSGPALRIFHTGMRMQYGYVIYNAQLDKATGRPQLQTQVRLFRDGKQVFAGRVQPFDTAGQTDLKRLVANGALNLGSDLTPGEYSLQIVVTDPLAKEKYRVATQWIDFEIAR